MATNIGPKIGIDGEKEFRDQLNNISNQIRTLSSDMKVVTSEFADNENAQESLTKQSELLNQQVDLQKNKIESIRKALEEATAKYGETDDKTLAWKRSLNNATVELNNMQARLGKTDAKLAEMSDTSAIAAAELEKLKLEQATALNQNISNISERIKTLGTEMRVVTSEFANSDDAQGNLSQQASILNAQIELQNQKLADLKKGLQNASAEFGDADSRTQKWKQEVNNATVELNNMRTRLSTTETALKNAERAIDDVDDALKDMGEAADKSGGLLAEAFTAGAVAGGVQAIISGLSEIIDETQEYNLAMAKLKTAGEDAGYSAEDTASAYSKMQAVIGDSDQAATATANLQSLGVEQDKVNELIDASIGGWAKYGSSIPIEGLAEGIAETAGLGTSTGQLTTVLEAAGYDMDTFNSKLSATSSTSERADIILQALADVGLTDAGKAFQTTNADMLAMNTANEKMNQNLARISEIIIPVAATVKTAVADIIGGFLDMVESGNPAIAVVGGLTAGIGAFALALQAKTAVEAINVAITGFKTANEAATLSQAALNAVMNANPIMLVVTALSALTAGLIIAYNTNDEFKSRVDTAFGTIKTNVLGIIDTLTEFFTEKIPSAYNDTIDWIEGIPDDMKTVGENLAKGLWEGISSKADWLKSKVTGFGDDILNELKDFFGIHSPSTVFRDEVGAMLAQGIGVGFDDNIATVNANMQHSIAMPTVDDLKNLTAGMVNGISANSGGNFGNCTITIPFYINGKEFYRASKADLLEVMRSSPEVVTV